MDRPLRPENRFSPAAGNAGKQSAVAQVKQTSDIGMLGGFSLLLASMAVFFLTVVRLFLLEAGWNARLELLVDGLVWSSAVGAVGCLVLLLSQGLRCLYDFTYRSVEPLPVEDD